MYRVLILIGNSTHMMLMIKIDTYGQIFLISKLFVSIRRICVILKELSQKSSLNPQKTDGYLKSRQNY